MTRIAISEVGARDGLQTIPDFVPTERKAELVNALARTGLKRIEVTGFVHPKIVPQMSDADALMALIDRPEGVRYAAFVPNARGAERAIAAGVHDLKAGVAASETFNQLNVRMSTEKGREAVREIAGIAKGTASSIVGVVGTAFGCPYDGPVPVERVAGIVELFAELGAPLVYLADTTGVADPRQIRSVVEHLKDRYPDMTIGLHLHNTRGLGIANALAGLDAGVVDFESSIGGLGGCPFAPRAVGNICTEDFVQMLLRMGYEVDPDLDALIAVAQRTEEILGHTLPGMVMKAGKASDRHVPKTAAP
jgi:hydroxymethylglutaryl-CoA lyase